ncbi:MAG: sugar phosphate isomerase/epimerase [Chloroflexi bacterium]|nr:sugar phosphate isomerase/epimerase [Chloroflexota bacterium]
METISIGVNLEYVRSSDKPFNWGAQKAAELGYRFVEPCVATGRDLLAEGGYYHMLSMEEDPLAYREFLDRLGLQCSALSAHSPLAKPEIAVNYLRQAIRWAAEIGAPVVTTDDGFKHPWMTDEEAFQQIRYTLRAVTPVAERHGIKIGLEQHQNLSTRWETFERMLNLVDSPMLGVNFDTGNLYLAGEDPIIWLTKLAPRVVHVHAKDIALDQAERERGKVTGTPVGCACGDGLVDWRQVVQILRNAGYQGVLSVECGTVIQAERSLAHLQQVITAIEAAKSEVVRETPAR